MSERREREKESVWARSELAWSSGRSQPNVCIAGNSWAWVDGQEELVGQARDGAKAYRVLGSGEESPCLEMVFSFLGSSIRFSVHEDMILEIQSEKKNLVIK